MQNNDNELLALIALLSVEGIGPVLARNLIRFAGSAHEVLKLKKSQLQNIPKIGEKHANDLSQASQYLNHAEQIIRNCERLNIQILTERHEAYPELLKHIYDPPMVLYVKGFMEQSFWGIGIVGTRSATAYGIHQTQELAKTLADNQIPVVSGLAYGIDYEAHKSCIQHNGRTVAVLACGLHTVYPKNHQKLAEDILLQGGALVSEYPPFTELHPNHFPMRNRILSGLCKAVVVMETAEKGGAMITAYYAFDQNREVWALPAKTTDPKSFGCLKLIQKNIAKIYLSSQELIHELNVPIFNTHKVSAPSLFLELSPEEEQIFKHIPAEPLSIEVLAVQCDMPMPILLSNLLALECKDLILQLPGNLVVRKG